METKICNDDQCTYKGQPQPITNFYLKKNGQSESKCKVCHCRKNKENRLKREGLIIQPLPKKKKRVFTEGARQALGYYRIY